MSGSRRRRDGLETALSGWLAVVLLPVAAAYLLLADYQPMALAALVAIYFVAYVFLRTLLWMENDRFTPLRLRVGLSWALTGFDPEAEEYDILPVRVYFLLLAVLASGLLLRPVARWVVG